MYFVGLKYFFFVKKFVSLPNSVYGVQGLERGGTSGHLGNCKEGRFRGRYNLSRSDLISLTYLIIFARVTSFGGTRI